MAFWRFINKLFSPRSGQQAPKPEQRYDHIQIKNVVDGSTITGHDAVNAYFEEEKRLHDTYGSSLIFQVYRVNLQAETIQQFQGEKLGEFKVDSGFVSGTDAVVVVKEKVRALLKEKSEAQRNAETQGGLVLEDTDLITFFFSGRPMQDNSAFYADNFIMLPAWIQVLLHRCTFEELSQRIGELIKQSQTDSAS